MPKKVKLLLLSAMVAGAVSAAPEINIPDEIPDEPFDLRADRLEFSNSTVMASGSVTGRFENAMIRADQVSGNAETGELKIEGNIHFERDNVIWNGDYLEYNYLTHSGDFGPSSLDFDPILMSVDHVERVSTNEFRLEGAEFTTCPEAHPHFHVRAKEARLVDQEYLKAKGVTVYAGKVPIFYVPYWRQKLQKSIFSFDAGFSSEWGAFVHVKATVPISRHIDWISDVNGYSKRGVGVGQGFAWNHPKAVGEFAAFYLKDQDPHARYDPSDPDRIGSQIGSDRYRFKFDHLQRFTDTFYLNTRLNYLSDPAVLEEFFKDEYRSYAQPENYMSWVYGNRYIGTEGFASHALNDFYSNTDRLEYSMDLYRTRIPGTPFYFQSENSIASLDKVVSVIDQSGAQAYDSARLDSANTLYMPHRISFLSLVPRVGYRGTWYSETDPAAGNGSEELRSIGSAGMEVSMQATKVLSDRERWYGKGLRHKIEPYADYIYDVSSVGTNRLYQFDSVDLLDDQNKMKLGLRNILQTKRNKQVSRFIDLDLYTHYLFENRTDGKEFDSLYVDARMPLTEKFMIDVLGVYDWNNDGVPFFNTRFLYDMDEVLISLEHLHRDSINSLWTPRVELFPTGNLSMEAFARYEGNDNELEEISLAGYFNWCCMRYGVGYRFYDENEHSIMFSIGLSAFPEARISSSF